MTDKNFDVSRRKMLGAIGTIGGAAALGGASTMAFFSDEENFANNELVAGELDLKVDWTEHYSDWSEDEADGITVSMTDESVGAGFPSAASSKMAYVSDKNQFLENTAIESFPDPDNDGTQEFSDPTSGTWEDGQGNQYDICTYDPDPVDGAGADTPEVLSDQFRTDSGPDGIGGSPNPQVTAPGDPLVNIEDVKPGDFGEVTMSLHVCGNPAWLWMTGDLVDADENGTNEAEESDEDEIGPGETDPEDRDLFDNEGDETNEENNDPDNTVQEPVELLDAVAAAVWYDTGSDGAFGTGDGGEGDNYHQANEVFVPLTGSLRNVLQVLEGGMVPLDYTPVPQGQQGDNTNDNGGTTQFPVCDDVNDAIDVLLSEDLGIPTARNISCEELDELLVAGGYVESGTEYVGTKFEESGGDIPTGTYSTPKGTITIESVDVQAGTITLSTDFPIEVVSMKGGNQGEKEYVFEDKGGTDPADPEQFGCILDSVTFSTPTNQPSGTVAAISNVELCWDSDIPDDDNGGGGQQQDGRECFPNSTTAYIGFEWWLPVDHANEIQSDSVSFDLGFYAEQCRHNDGSGQPPENGGIT